MGTAVTQQSQAGTTAPSASAHAATRTLTSPFPEQERNLENLCSKLRQNAGISLYTSSS